SIFAGEIHCRSAACLQGNAYLQGVNSSPSPTCLQGKSIFAGEIHCRSAACLQGNAYLQGVNSAPPLHVCRGTTYL
ncbi:hypothetical protein AB7W30_17875, partial [Providencia manganoxydans]|uniref:hypothetical protein n=1 Tax=Providencia manganoxydans TaxID=2923283 RepID=UPI0032DA5ED4